ncbi:MAG: N-succinylarginine dihydrolase [Nannocystaceae bacterium]
MSHFEVNFDGLIGPTHNYSGLSFGNVASLANVNAVASPKQAAKQGLAKMWTLRGLGLHQGVIAPQERPDLHALRRLGFSGSDAAVLEAAARAAPSLLAACSSASSMWVANAATVSPSADTGDGRVHFTPANLVNKLHRSIEPEVTGRILRAIFPSAARFAHHRHLPSHDSLGDEGAANHTRLCADYGAPGVEVFVFGRSVADPARPRPARYPARQTLEASEAVARLHGLGPGRAVFVQQNPAVIDAGVFHNDVIAVGNLDVLFFHQEAFYEAPRALEAIDAALRASGLGLRAIEVPTAAVPVADAVASYLFNTQLVAPAGRGAPMVLVAPEECRETPSVRAYLEELAASDGPIGEVVYIDVRQSMRNGGGPACLRLRVALSDDELAAVNPRCLLDETLYRELDAWIDRHYRDRLSFDDLRDPALLVESRAALDELTQLLDLGAVYPFQRGGADLPAS